MPRRTKRKGSKQQRKRVIPKLRKPLYVALHSCPPLANGDTLSVTFGPMEIDGSEPLELVGMTRLSHLDKRMKEMG